MQGCSQSLIEAPQNFINDFNVDGRHTEIPANDVIQGNQYCERKDKIQSYFPK